ncbi:endonuclease/exonuclease/phosphatase family protein [Limnochorda pilosa]|uniref:Endonuclease/exonuclease/phosphatase domain-containing protein n=1 Tax=Limnochorda pilosa TaxID=1555112 RepID=A0A0K2SIC9_LIMPI|nr:endonuclease/exonuclease/phosphatase family protein [Limnochorda pilosa]BAS26772.1 hypothetical protein LIP_0915 [Limnochorda pilosa]
MRGRRAAAAAMLVLAALVFTEGLVLAQRSITLMTWNIKHALGCDGLVDLDRIAQVIEASGADVVGLNEVDRGFPRSGMVFQARYLAERLGFDYAFAPAFAVATGSYGNAILSRYPILESWTVALPADALSEPRSAAVARIDVGEAVLSFVSTHLDHKDARIRRNQALRVHEELQALPNPKVLAGDLNAWAVTAEVTLFQRVMNDAHTLYRMVACTDRVTPERLLEDGYTLPSTAPTSRIDYIFLSPDLRLEEGAGGYRVLPTVASDHLPVVATVRLRPEGWDDL